MSLYNIGYMPYSTTSRGQRMTIDKRTKLKRARRLLWPRFQDNSLHNDCKANTTVQNQERKQAKIKSDYMAKATPPQAL